MKLNDKVIVTGKVDYQGFVGIIKNTNDIPRFYVEFDVKCPLCDCIRTLWCWYDEHNISHITDDKYNQLVDGNKIDIDDYNR